MDEHAVRGSSGHCGGDSPQPGTAAAIGHVDAGSAPPSVIDPGAVGTPSLRRCALQVGLLLAAGFLLCLFLYLVVAVPSQWFPGVSARAWGVADLALARGSGTVSGDELVVTAVDPSGIAIVSVSSNLRAADFPAISWIATDIAEDAEVRLVWRTNVHPQRLNSAAITVTAGQPMPSMLAADKAWIGQVTGLALTIRTSLDKPIRIRGVVARPMGAMEILRDRAREWLAFEEWTGSSINTVVGGVDVQDLPLPPLAAAACAAASALLLALRRWRPRPVPEITAGLVLALFAMAWLVLDARWTWNLIRQEQVTVRAYGGLTATEKHLAAEDGALFAFVERARRVMPETPARVFVVAGAAYFRGRAAYHLYPHRVYTDRINGTMPPASALRPGDWLVDFESRAIAYDAVSGRLRWSGDQTIAAEPRLVLPGAALFLVR